MGRVEDREKAEVDYIYAFSRVTCSDINTRIVLHLDKTGGASKEELLRSTLAGNEGIFEYNLGELIRLGTVSSDSPYRLTKLGKRIVDSLKPVLP